MSASFRPTFGGIHRQSRHRSLRLGQDWHLEVRPLALRNALSKSIQVKDLPAVINHESKDKPTNLGIPPAVS